MRTQTAIVLKSGRHSLTYRGFGFDLPAASAAFASASSFARSSSRIRWLQLRHAMNSSAHGPPAISVHHGHSASAGCNRRAPGAGSDEEEPGEERRGEDKDETGGSAASEEEEEVADASAVAARSDALPTAALESSEETEESLLAVWPLVRLLAGGGAEDAEAAACATGMHGSRAPLAASTIAHVDATTNPASLPTRRLAGAAADAPKRRLAYADRRRCAHMPIDEKV